MVQMGQFQGWADDEESEYYKEGPPYSTCDADPWDEELWDEDEHTTTEVEEIKKEEVKKKPETKKK
jgi:hypothetical protein